MNLQQLEEANALQKAIKDLQAKKAVLMASGGITLSEGGSYTDKLNIGGFPTRHAKNRFRSTSELIEEISKDPNQITRALATESVLFIERLIGIYDREIEKLNQQFNEL